jgi:hypothetical protein
MKQYASERLSPHSCQIQEPLILPAGRTAPRQIKPTCTIIRRPTYHQGRALEKIGHAIEYLVDTNLYDPSVAVDAEAIGILASASRNIFAECPEIVTVGMRIRRKVASLVHRLIKGSKRLEQA